MRTPLGFETETMILFFSWGFAILGTICAVLAQIDANTPNPQVTPQILNSLLFIRNFGIGAAVFGAVVIVAMYLWSWSYNK